jgi:hypothetical protein
MALVVLFAAASSQASLISINFGAVSVTNPPDALHPQSGNWNNITASQLALGATVTGLIDSDGAIVTGLTLKQSSTSTTPSDQGYLINTPLLYPPTGIAPATENVGSSGIKVSVTGTRTLTISGIPAWVTSVDFLGAWYENLGAWAVNTGGTVIMTSWAGQGWQTTFDTTARTLVYRRNTTDGAGLSQYAVQLFPEPATLALLGVGLAGLIFRRKK